jgi:hypothetical protein
MTPRGLMRCSRRYPTAALAESALQAIVDAGLGRWVVPASNGHPGRPSDSYVLLETSDVVDRMPTAPPATVIRSTSTGTEIPKRTPEHEVKEADEEGRERAAAPAGDGASADVPQTEAEAEAWRKRKKQEAAFDHTTALAVSLYAHQLKAVTGKDCRLDKSQTAFIVDLWDRFRPRDPVEEMLLMQMIQTHCRHMHVSSFAGQQHNLKWAGMMYEAAERAANTFRRQMLALAEYRRPPRPKSFTAIGQANIAQQQVVQNGPAAAGGAQIGKNENRNATNEKGLPPPPPALPADAGGAGVPAELGLPHEALAPDVRADNDRREAAE